MAVARAGGPSAAAQKRAERARQGRAAGRSNPSRGETVSPEDDVETGGGGAASHEPEVEPDGTDVPGQPDGSSATVTVPTQTPQQSVTLGREADEGLTYKARPKGASREEWLQHVTRGISLANAAAEKQGAKLQEDYVLSAGRYCHDLIENKLHKEAGYSSVDVYAKQVLKMSRDDVYRLAGAVPVYQSLKGLLDGPLDKTQVAELGKAYRGGGKERPEEEKQAACRLLWEQSMRNGDTSSRGIARTRQALALGSMRDLELKDPKPVSAPPPRAVVRKVERVLTSDLDAFRKLVDEDPEAAKAHVDKVGEHYQALQEALG